jgi:hypothetical protein
MSSTPKRLAETERGFVKAIICQEDNDQTFEQFTRSLVELEEGVTLVRTSPTWDRGRDARSIGSSAGVYVAASVNKQVEDKALSDVQRIASTTASLRTLYFCSSQELSEHACDALEVKLKGLLPPNVQITVLGSRQLIDLAFRHQEVFFRYYLGEITSLRDAEGEEGSETAEQLALKLALCTRSNADSAALRADLLRQVLLHCIKRGYDSIAKLSVAAAGLLRLPNKLPESIIEEGVRDLIRDRMCSSDQTGAVELTDLGRFELEQRGQESAKELLAGPALLREELQKRLSYELSTNHYDRIWEAFQQYISTKFYNEGFKLISIVRNCCLPGERDEGVDGGQDNLGDLVSGLSTKAGDTSSDPDQKQELETAVRDMFKEKGNPAFDWLAHVCVAYISLCALGIEQSTAQELQKGLQRSNLVFDTDIVLSLLCESEVNHQGVAELLRRWREYGGEIWMAEPVLREAAYHAWIAEQDFQNTKHWLPGEAVEGERYIENAFVRSFAGYLRSREARLRQWRDYITEFRGKREDDNSTLRAYCILNHKIKCIPESYDPKKQTEILEFVLSQRTNRHPIHEDKAKRDAELVSQVMKQRQLARTQGLDKTYIIVSSSKLFRAVERRFHADLEERVLVLPIGGVMYWLSLIPGVTVTLRALKSLLFSESLPLDFGNVERIALRIIRDSAQFEVPWAKRANLRKKLDIGLSRISRQQGISEEKARKDFVAGKESVTIPVLAEALDDLAVDPKITQELEAAKQKIKELERKRR